MASEKVNYAAVLDGPRGEFQLRPTDIPSPGPGEILIKVARIALNQIDRRVALHAAFPLPYPAILGACVAGRVEAVGSRHDASTAGSSPGAAAPQSAATLASQSSSFLPRLAVGDRVAAYTSYYSRKDHKDNRFGAFQQYVLCNERTVLKLGDSDDLSSGASIIASAPLAAVALSQHVGIPLRDLNKAHPIVPGSNGEQQQRELKLLCYGAATGIGGFVTQMAAQCRQKVICTAKTANHEYIRQLGAHKVFDYTDTATVVQQLADEGPYDAIVDCISTQETIRLLNSVVQIFRARGADATANNNTNTTTKNNNSDKSEKNLPVIYTVLPVTASSTPEQGEKSDVDEQRCATKFMWLTAPFGMDDRHDFTRWLFWDVLQSHLDSGRLVATPSLLIKGGLGALREAMDRMGTVSAQKVVVSLDE